MSSVDAARIRIIETVFGLRYAGKRMTARKIGAIIDRIPHDTYIEPMVGMETVFFKTRPVKTEVLNDLDCKVVKQMKRQACRKKDQTDCNRLKKAKILCGKDYREVIRRYDSKNALIYLDPPYENTKCEYRHCDVSTKDIVKVMKRAKGTVLMSNDPKNRKDICGDTVRCRIIPFKFWGNPRKDLLAIKKAR